MKPIPLKEAARVMDATLAGAEGGVVARGASVDSRAVREGDLFFAFRGRVDGAGFADQACAAGAVATVADRPLGTPTLVVDDVLKAMQKLARWTLCREDTPSPTIVGITGTVGKTTTKDALATILRVAGRRVSATAGNLNNEIGLPLTVLNAAENTEMLVLEMGATHKGDISGLCDIAPPKVGILTAISPVHLDSFGSLEALARAKGELALALPEDGAFVAPAGVPEAAVAPGRKIKLRIRFNVEGGDLWASRIEEREEGLCFVVHADGRSAEVRTPVFGTHLVQPLLAAIGGGLALGLDLKDCAAGVSRLRRTGLRGELYRLKDDIIVYDDSYNASPAAVAAVLRYAARQARAQGRRLVAVLGGMFELGPNARAYHRECGELGAELGVGLLVCVGDEARWYAETFPGEKIFCEDARSATGPTLDALRPGDYVVVKGSRGVQLDTLTRNLRENLALV